MSKIQQRSEQLVINAILNEPSCIHDVMSSVSSDMFQFPDNKLIFEAISFLYLSQEPVGLITVFKQLSKSKSMNKQQALGELSHIYSMFSATDRYEAGTAVRFLLSESVRHEHIDFAKKIGDISVSDDYEPSTVIDMMQSHILDNKLKKIVNKKEMTNEDLINELDKKMIESATHSGISGIKTGYERFDRVTSGMQPTNFIIVAARPAMGKELSNNARVYTDNGYKLMGEIKQGDKVLGSNGKECNVTNVFPQGLKDTYRIHFDDGSYVDCGLEHQWEVSTRATRRNGQGAIVTTTKEMIGNEILKDGRKNFSIRMCQPLQFKSVYTEINPYLMGALIGDGSFSSTNVCFSNSERDVIEKVELLLPEDCKMKHRKGYDYSLNGMMKYIKKIGLKGVGSHQRFIPKEFLYNSVEARISLLRGLIDTDGFVIASGRNAIEYSTSSERLCNDILELVRGLGGKASFKVKKTHYRKEGVKIECKDSYRMYLSLPESIIPVSSMKHLAKYNGKKQYHAKFITNIEKLGTQEEMTCIAVDADDCLYVTDGCTLTHNTQFALGVIRNASIKDDKKGLFISCEMDEVQLMKRIIAVDSGIPGYSLKRGSLTPSERGRYERSRKRIINSGVKIVAGTFTIADVLSLIYKLKHSQGLDYVVIDYIQKITSPNAQNRTNEVGDVSRKLKDAANDLKIPIIALAQLSRAVEHRVDKKPQLSDLRESGDIEQDADIVTFLYRPSYYMSIEEREMNPLADDGYLVIAKHRDGELEDIHLKFDGNIPAWKNPNERDDYTDEYVQTAMSPNIDF
jgi:replicative DNA helicase